MKSKGFLASGLSTYDFSTLYTTLPHNLIKEKLTELIEQTFNREGSLYFACNYKNAFFTSEQPKRYKLWSCQKMCDALHYILSETSKPPLDIFSYILTYMIHTWLQFTLNMGKSVKESLSKFHFHKLKLTCSIDRLYKGTIAFRFHTNAKIRTHRLKPSIPGT